jgi:Fe-S cluster biogenesis protein NfuA
MQKLFKYGIGNFNKKNYRHINYINTLRFMFSIFVKVQQTPNPHSLKFLPGKNILEEGETYDFANIRNAMNSPLAVKLFEVKGVNRVFYGRNYVSVGKEELTEWNDIKPLVIDVICDYFTKNLELFDKKPQAEDTKINENDSSTVALIKEIIAVRIRSVVQEDGGDIEFINFDEGSGIVYLAMKGSCSGCPSSSVTLKNGIEKMLIYYVPDVKGVEAVE